MITKREVLILVLAAAIMGYLYEFMNFSWNGWLMMSLLGLIIVSVHALGQKISAAVYDASTEVSIWKLEQFGWYERSHFKQAFPAGIFIPIIFLFATMGYVKLLMLTSFDIISSASKKRVFAKITEMQLAIIALSGSIANVLLAFIAFILGYQDFALMNLAFVFFSLIPISSMDGAKIFFGSRLLWVFSFVFILSLIILFEVAGLWASLLSALMIAVAIAVAYYLSFEA